ncbi:MAG TPA: ABC transporter substrate-binding protein [Solirubrobacteraceae bacterium]
MRLRGLERAVLAVALARPRERQREVARERDAAAHRRSLRTALVAAIVVLAGCGGSGSDGAPNSSATLTLDFQPNAVHTGIELAVERGFTDAEGVDLEVRAPSQSTDSVALLLTGRTKFAILDLHDLAIARDKGRDLVAVMAIVQDPLAAVIAQPGTASPKALEGKRVGVTGLPSDVAVLDSVVRGAGGDPAKVRRVTIGFEAVPALISGRVAAATAFWNAEGVAIADRRPGTKVFRMEDYGAPAYPELVLTVTRETLQDDPDLVRATVHALQRGYRETLADPESGIEALVKAAPGTKRGPALKELNTVASSFRATDGTIGTFNARRLARWAAWEQRFGIVKRPPAVAQMFAGDFARSGAKKAAEEDG